MEEKEIILKSKTAESINDFFKELKHQEISFKTEFEIKRLKEEIKNLKMDLFQKDLTIKKLEKWLKEI